MDSTLDVAKKEIKSLLENLYETVATALERSMKAFEDLDCDMADSVTKKSRYVEKTHHAIEDKIFDAITSLQPQNKELRRFIAYLNTSNGLQSVGRFATKIAEIVKMNEGLDHFKELITLPYLAELATAALSISIRAVIEEDLSEIDELEKLDAESDSESADMFQEIADYLGHLRGISNIAMLYVIVGRYFERTADQAISIAEYAVFLVTGKRRKLGLVYKGIDDISDVAIDI